MGADIYGIAFYGFPITNQDNINTIGEWDDWVDGWQTLFLEHEGIGDYPDNREEWADHSKRRQEVLESSMCEIGQAGFDSEGYLYVYITDSKKLAEWGEMIELDTQIKPMWEFKLKKFCEIIGLVYSQPKWYLTSKYW